MFKKITKFDIPIELCIHEDVVDAILERYDGEDAEREMYRVKAVGDSWPYGLNEQERKYHWQVVNGYRGSPRIPSLATQSSPYTPR